MSSPEHLQTDDSQGLSLRDALRVVARWKWLILGLTLALGAASFGYSLTQPKLYTATTSLKYEQQVNVANPLGQNNTDPYTVQQELASVSSQLSDPALKSQVAQSVGLKPSDTELTPTATAIANSNVVTITAIARIIPPPAITPSSLTPLKPLSPMAKNAAAFVIAAVIMLAPVCSMAVDTACRASAPLLSSSS